MVKKLKKFLATFAMLSIVVNTAIIAGFAVPKKAKAAAGPPTNPILSAPAGQTAVKDGDTVSVSAQDVSGLATVEARIVNSTEIVSTQPLSEGPSGVYSGSFNLPTPIGATEIRAEATNDNYTSLSCSSQLVVDNNPPGQVTGLVGSYTNQSNVDTLSWNWDPVSDETMVKYSIELYRSGFGLITGQNNIIPTNYTYSPTVDQGQYYLKVKAVDSAANEGLFTQSSLVTSDKTAPPAPQSVEIIGGLITQQNQNDLKVTVISGLGTNENNATIKVSISDGIITGTAQRMVANLGSQEVVDVQGIIASAFKEGVVDLSATIIDTAGNESGITSGTATKITIGPQAPANLNIQTDDATASISWDPVAGAVGYKIRWRQEDAPAGTYSEMFLAGFGNTSTTILGLENGRNYLFTITAVDSYGNESLPATISGTPNKIIAGPIKPQIGIGIATYKAPTEAPTEVVPPSEEIQPEQTAEGEIKGKEEEEAESNWSRLIVALSIIIIAIGAGTGGYYGYQWWMERQSKKTGVKSEQENRRNRW